MVSRLEKGVSDGKNAPPCRGGCALGSGRVIYAGGKQTPSVAENRPASWREATPRVGRWRIPKKGIFGMGR